MKKGLLDAQAHEKKRVFMFALSPASRLSACVTPLFLASRLFS
jgi:hypothetical protein